MKVVVTGGLGFIGSHIVDAYVSNGASVTIVDNLYSGKKENFNVKAKLIQMSLLDDALEEMIIKEKPDIINHHAAQINVITSVSEPIKDIHLNLIATAKVLEAAGKSRVKKVLYASSGGTVYGQVSNTYYPIRETELGQSPVSPYGINKLAGEHYVKFYAEKYGFNWATLRYSNVYGPRQNPHGESGVISIFTNQLKQGKRPVVYGDGEQVRDFIHVDDVVSANMLLSKLDLPDGAYNVGTEVGTTVNQLLDYLSAVYPSANSPIYNRERDGDLRWSILCNQKLKYHGWIPRISIKQGIVDLSKTS